MMPRDLLSDEYVIPRSTKRMPRDLLELPQQETFGEAIKQAPIRLAQDVASGANRFLQNTPEYWEKAKTEIPGFINPKNWLLHPIERGGQTLAGLLELAQNINHAPRDVAQYAANRLHLIPEEWANKVPQAPDLDEDIAKYIGEPKRPGDVLSRGLARNADLLVGVNALAKAMPHLTKRGATKKLRKANALAEKRNIGTLNVDPELIEDARQFLPDLLQHRNQIEGSHIGDYKSLFNLQSDVGKISAARRGRIKSLFAPESHLKGEAGLKSRNNLLNAIHENLKRMDHNDISDLLREGQNDFRRYSKFKKYRNALGVAGAAYAIPQNPLTNLMNKLFHLSNQ